MAGTPPQSPIEAPGGADTIRSTALAAEQGSAPSEPSEQENQAPRGKASVFRRLMEIAGKVEPWHDRLRSPWVTVPVARHTENLRVQHRDFRLWLTGEVWREHGAVPSDEQLESVLRLTAARAVHDGGRHKVQLRVGGSLKEERIYVALADRSRRVVEISPDGWQVISEPSVKFWCPAAMCELPAPAEGGSVDLIRRFVHTESEEHFKLFVFSLLAALHPAGPYIVVIFCGEQGSGKSTALRVFRELTDPNLSTLRALPRDERDLAVGIGSNWVMSFDNLSKVPAWASDAICRLSSGAGFSTRKLLTDDDEIVLVGARPVVMTGIPTLASRPDLLDRSLSLEMIAIPDNQRRTENEFWNDFERDRPKILGVLYSAAAHALRTIKTTKLDKPPRMSDFALWCTAAEQGLGWPSGSFAAAFASNRATATRQLLDDSLLAEAITRIATQGDWEDTPTALLRDLDALVDEKSRARDEWPATPSRLGNALMRLAPALRQAGIEVTSRKGGSKSRRAWRIRKISAPNPDPVDQSSPPDHTKGE